MGDHGGPPLGSAPASRSWQRAFGDLRQGWRQRPLWGYLGWQDIKQRYRRSVLGPLWISISMGVVATAMGILYGTLFNEPLETFLRHHHAQGLSPRVMRVEEMFHPSVYETYKL